MSLKFSILAQRSIAILVATCAVVILAITIVLLQMFPQINMWFIIVPCGIAMFVAIYYLAMLLIRAFVVEKVRPIYKVIRSAQMPKFKELAKSNANLIEVAAHDAEDWASRKSEEIEQLKKLETFRKEYIGNVAHELRTPIFTIQGYVSTLLDGGLYDESINRQYLERSDKVIQRMTMIVRDLDAISRLESGELKMEFTTFNIVDLVNEVFEAQEYLARANNVTFSVETTKPKAAMLVFADRMRISMVLSNLITNAIKYNKPENGSVRVRFFDMDSRLLVEISDTGIGIPQEYLDRIFERFFRVDKSRSREQGGTGLGLAIVKHVIEAHGESVNVKSEMGKGTSFSFTIKKGNY